MEKHTDDLRNVREGDTVEFTSTEGLAYRFTCTEYVTQHADSRSGEVRETRIWTFEQDDVTLHATILDGLRSSPDDPEFPQHTELWDPDVEETLGYIEELRIFGEMES